MTLIDSSSGQVPVFNLAHDHRPDRVVTPGGTTEVVAAIEDAARCGHSVRVVGTGHGLTFPIDGGTALLTSRLATVEVDRRGRRARVGAGATWQQVIDASAPLGLAPVCGSAPGVGVVGFLLGGGVSPLGRTLGWASDRVLSIELVTGSGDLVTATPATHPELFRALRGGKVAPGVVTAVEIELLPLTSMVAGALFFAAEHAEVVLETYVRWSASLPETVTTSAALLRLPDLDVVPAPLRGRFVVSVRVATLLGNDEAVELVAPLRSAAPPLMDTLGEMPYAAIGMVHADPVDPMPALEAGMLLGQLDVEAVEALLTVAGPDVPAPFAVVEVRQLGGALARTPDVPDAVAGRGAAYSLFVVSAPAPELFVDVVPAATSRLLSALEPWSTGGVQPNFVGTLNGPDALDRAWSTEVRLELEAVQERYDPDGMFA